MKVSNGKRSSGGGTSWVWSFDAFVSTHSKGSIDWEDSLTLKYFVLNSIAAYTTRKLIIHEQVSNVFTNALSL